MFLLLPPNGLDLRMGFGTKGSQGTKILGQVKGSALTPGLLAEPHQDNRIQGKHDCPEIGSGGCGRAPQVALGCPIESAGHSLSVQAALASSGGSSSHWRWARDSGAGEAAPFGVFPQYPYHTAWQFYMEHWHRVALGTTFSLQNKSKFHRVR